MTYTGVPFVLRICEMARMNDTNCIASEVNTSAC